MLVGTLRQQPTKGDNFIDSLMKTKANIIDGSISTRSALFSTKKVD